MQILANNYKNIGNKKSLKFGCNGNKLCLNMREAVDTFVEVYKMPRSKAVELVKKDVAGEEKIYKKAVEETLQEGTISSENAEDALLDMHIMAAEKVYEDICIAEGLNKPYEEIKNNRTIDYKIILKSRGKMSEAEEIYKRKNPEIDPDDTYFNLLDEFDDLVDNGFEPEKAAEKILKEAKKKEAVKNTIEEATKFREVNSICKKIISNKDPMDFL